MAVHTNYEQLINDIKMIGTNKTCLTYNDSLSMAKVTEQGIRLLERKIDKINNEHEEIRTIIVDDKECITNLHINAIDHITNALNNEHKKNISRTKKMEEIRVLDNSVDNTQKDISDMLDYCENIIEQANKWLINKYKKELYDRCQLKKLK